MLVEKNFKSHSFSQNIYLKPTLILQSLILFYFFEGRLKFNFLQEFFILIWLSFWQNNTKSITKKSEFIVSIANFPYWICEIFYWKILGGKWIRNEACDRWQSNKVSPWSLCVVLSHVLLGKLPIKSKFEMHTKASYWQSDLRLQL